ncbi:WD repeat-containing protein 44 [Camellia lanceoleosa]|uniref:WD repeat-containing protein 44 n=1 Tax=Camellia lanceoleosa TaxID=1840588 RepID=A0ACC0IYX8_9ERIC|nr:WD repeat-containing protein 44 [Camellia lanceoleosa]
MMGSFRDEEYRFFDAHEGMASASDCLKSPDSSFGVDNGVSTSFEYQPWTKIPQSVQERRSKFLNWMGGLNSDQMVSENQVVECSDLREEEIDRITKDSGAVLRTSSFEDEFTSSRSSMSSWANDVFDVPEECGSNVYRIGNLGSGTVCSVDELGKKGEQPKLQVLGVDQLVPPEEFENNFDSSPAVQQSMRRETEVASNLVGAKNRVKNKWLSRLRSMTRIGDRQGGANNLRPTHPNPVRRARVQRVKVRHCRKRWKELSALFTGQDIQAHKGSIFTMKFSLDGQFLATAGEDCIVRVWQVVEDTRSIESDIPDIDPSCVYFTVNHLSELAPLVVEKEKSSKLKSLRKTEDSACVIFPPRVFRILEEPLHQFHGHNGEILDLSWSENNFLLSSSVDTTVRLWQVGCWDCIKVFQHNNYVTCIQFNPLNSNHFISGSIDGKVRIWEVTGCQVVDWTDVKDIVTAVCYRPDGQGVVVGFMTGTCRFYDISDDHFQLEAQICLHSKKKTPCKRITCFQFFPQDPSKLMVTCADSQVRILHGINVVGKYKGVRNTGNQLFASFTSDGKHIVSTCDDSNVYLWNCINQEEHSLSQPKIIRSWERFSTNALIAIPWSGLKSENSGNGWQLPALDESSSNALPLPSPTRFFLDQEFILESFPKGSATWPEEKLLSSSPRAVKTALHKSQYKFLKSSCKSTSSSHAWDLVIVTAGCDGRIRSFHNYGLPVAL